jgi:hypothetical protein
MCFADATVIFQDINKELYQNFQWDFADAGTIELSVQTLDSLVKGLYPGFWSPCSLHLIPCDFFLW